MSRDAVVLGVLVLAFATLTTVHVSIALALARRPPRWRSAVALVLAPLAPWWALRERMLARGAAWIVAGVVYCAALWLALE
ncbi:MAG TPA: hypothetical protein VE987_15010 [Polyangiaceae bacterium]|nr:hypothetical protein [Polyangiaceae bacterium]